MVDAKNAMIGRLEKAEFVLGTGTIARVEGILDMFRFGGEKGSRRIVLYLV